MNKRFSTLLAAFAAFASVASAQVTSQNPYVMLTNGSNALTWTKNNAAGVDSLVLTATPTAASAKAAADSALWEVKVLQKLPTGNQLCRFINKATGKVMSFATPTALTGAGTPVAAYTTKIAAGIDSFVYSNSSVGSAIYISYNQNYYGITVSSSNVTLNYATTVPASSDFTNAAAPIIQFKTVADLTGAANISSFALNFNGGDGDEFAEGQLVPTLVSGDKFKLQLADNMQATVGKRKVDQFITIDTVATGNIVKAAGFQLDTTAVVGTAAYQGASNSGLQSFYIYQDLGTDSLSILADSMVAFNKAGEYFIATHGGNTANPYIVGYKSFIGNTALVIDSAQIQPANITFNYGTPVKLANGTGVYSMKVVGSSTAARIGKYVGGQSDYVAGVTPTANTPYFQIYVKETVNGVAYTYTAQARQGATLSTADNKYVATSIFNNELLYSVAGQANTYYTQGGDTLLILPIENIDMTNTSVGYKYFSAADMGKGAISFQVNSTISNAYLDVTKDSVLVGDNTAQDFKLITSLNNTVDTVYYGAQTLGDTLMAVAYGMQIPYQAKLGSMGICNDSVLITQRDSTVRFFFTSNAEGTAYTIDTLAVPYTTVNGPVATAEMVTLNVSNGKVAYTTPLAGVTTYYSINEAAAPTYAQVAPGHYNVVNANNTYEMLTSNSGVAQFMRPGDELKATADTFDFSLWIDSAYVNRGANNTNFGYYIYKGAEVVNDTVMGNVLWAPVADNFVSESAIGDSAMFVPVKVLADTMWYNNGAKKVTVQKNSAVVMFKVIPGTEEYNVVQMTNTNNVLAVVNGTVIFTEEVLPNPVKLVKAGTPTSNEGVTVSEVTVIAGQGNVTIAGAAGKKVVISNIIGQVVANTVLSSDNAVVAAPQGVVVVAVEGEAAVKAIVK